MARTMRRFARWHIWLGWLAGVPLLMWTLSGLVMVAKPIEEVRGEHLRLEAEARPGFSGNPRPIDFRLDGSPQAVELRSFIQHGRFVTLLTRPDGSFERFDATTGRGLPRVDEQEARRIVARSIRDGDQVASIRLTDADDPPIDFRRPMAAWQVTLADGTHVYVGRDSGEIAAVRTRWWRVFDFFWGLHIMDLQTREDTHHPVLIGFAALALVSTVLGVTLLFRRRRSKTNLTPPSART